MRKVNVVGVEGKHREQLVKVSLRWSFNELVNYLIEVMKTLISYRGVGSVETLISTSQGQWRDESRRQTQTPHTKLEQIL